MPCDTVHWLEHGATQQHTTRLIGLTRGRQRELTVHHECCVPGGTYARANVVSGVVPRNFLKCHCSVRHSDFAE